MTRVAFIGLGNMGSGMSANQAKAGREVVAFDLSADAMAKATAAGMTAANSAAEAVKDVDYVFTMLPAGQHVREIYEQQILPNARKDALLIDCSTIDVDSARTVARDASMNGFRAADAPVSGGTAAAAGGTLTFMVGCRDQDFAEMEAFVLAEKLGLDPQKFFDISSKASGQCWSLTSYCPWPGPVPAAPSNKDYEGGFAAAMMLKDLKLAQEAAMSVAADTPLGGGAEALYAELVGKGHAAKDFSFMLQMLRGAA